MAWKTERWLQDLFPGSNRVYEEYRKLPTRELVIVASAVLDAALAEILAKRFRDYPDECESFLGVNGDGRAPAASFGSRIQLALLIGIITLEDAAILRSMKNLRNIFAHRVNAEFLAEPALGQARKLLENWRALAERMIKSGVLQGSTVSLDEIESYLDKHSGAGEGLILAVFSTYQAYFHLLEPHVKRINIVKRKNA